MSIKINIALKLSEGAYGGSHQFLKALRNYLQKNNMYEDNNRDANVIVFSASQDIPEAIRLKKQFPDKVFVHRIDGPIRLYTDIHDKRDLIVNMANRFIADATIFQSEWSEDMNSRMGLKKNNFESVIINAPNPLIFNREQKQSFSNQRKIRLIATSWSVNWKKGFQVYQWLDEHLDFEKYEMTFIGNSPLKFKNIRHINPLPSHELAVKLKENDIFIFASEIEACSNSLLEAIHCGLPTVAFNGSSNIEIIGKGGLLFDKPEEIPIILKSIIQNYSEYQSNIRLPSMEEVGKSYYKFMYSIYEAVKMGKYVPKRLVWKQYGYIRAILLKWKLEEKIRKFLPI